MCLKVTKDGDNYLVKLNHNELLLLINTLGEKQYLVRQIASIINPDEKKKKAKQQARILETLTAVLGPDEWK